MRSRGSSHSAALIHYPNSSHTGRCRCTNHHNRTRSHYSTCVEAYTQYKPHPHTQNHVQGNFNTHFNAHKPWAVDAATQTPILHPMLKQADETFPKSWQLAGKEIPPILSLSRSMQSDKKEIKKREGLKYKRRVMRYQGLCWGIKQQRYIFHHHTLAPLCTHIHMLLHNDGNKLKI